MADEIFSAQNLPRTKSATYQDVYSNQVLASLGPYDISLVFGRIKQMVLQPGAAPMLVNEDQVTITLPPSQFKLLAGLCARITEAYEQAYVPIPLSDADLAPKISVEQIVSQIKGAQKAALSLAEPEKSTSSSGEKPARRRLVLGVSKSPKKKS